MKKIAYIALLAIGLAGCFRQEIQVAEYRIPTMEKPETASYIEKNVRQLTGIKEVSYDLQKQTLTVTYDSNTIRFMNIEETIARSGFTVNNRPANPQAKAKLPDSVK